MKSRRCLRAEFSLRQSLEPDDCQDYGEERWLGVAPARGELYTVVFTLRNDDETMRIISLRCASNSEVRRYETQGRK